MAVTVGDIADLLGRAAPDESSPLHAQWSKWIARAERAIERRATRCGVAIASLNPEDVDEVVSNAVVRLALRPGDGAESISEQVGVDDGSAQETRRYGVNRYGDNYILNEWWDILGLANCGERKAFTIRLGGRAGYR